MGISLFYRSLFYINLYHPLYQIKTIRHSKEKNILKEMC